MMNTTRVGRVFEELIAERLRLNGYRIIERNWRTRSCEIDIIASKNSSVYFIEAKYRKSMVVGVGLESITLSKRRRMHYAANLWSSQNNWTGTRQLIVATTNEKRQLQFVPVN